MTEKVSYEAAEIEVIYFGSEDIITTSGNGDDGITLPPQ